MQADWTCVWHLALALVLTAPSMAVAQSAGQSPYKVVSEEQRDDGASLVIRLERRLSESQLSALADVVRLKRLQNKPQIASIAFHLPASPLTAPAWATARFHPETRVAIAGLRREEEDAYRAAAATDARQIVGVWLTSPPALPGMLTIFRDRDRRFFAEWRLRSGQKTLDEVHQSIGSRGKRYDIAAAGGGYYLALWGGALQLGDGDAVIALAERLDFEKKPLAPAVAAADARGREPGAAPAAAATVEQKPRRSSGDKRATARAKPKREQSASDVLSASLRGD